VATKGAVALIGLLAAGIWWMTAGREVTQPAVGDSVHETGDSPSGVAANSAETNSSTLSPFSPTLDARYEACVKAAGFDPGGVQVLVRVGGDVPTPEGASNPAVGQPAWVKTGVDVPAGIHSPCMVQIGGAYPGMSSHGN
jgi:hypothetical protein